MSYLNFSKYVFIVITTYLCVWPLKCENVDLYKNCGKDLHKHLIWFPPFSSHKSQLQSYLWTNAFLVEQQLARCLTMWKDSILLIVARFGIGLVNLSKKIWFFSPRELLCIFRTKLVSSQRIWVLIAVDNEFKLDEISVSHWLNYCSGKSPLSSRALITSCPRAFWRQHQTAERVRWLRKEPIEKYFKPIISPFPFDP